MTEPIFKAPLPPEGNGFNAPSSPQKNGEEVEEASPQKTGKEALQEAKQKIITYLWYVLGGTVLVGLIFGLLMGGGEAPAPAPECLLKHIRNSDIQGRFKPCGTISKSEACIFYIMNTTIYEKKAEDFFDEAHRLMERTRYSISLENPTYSKRIIPPGYFAQIKVPSLR